jgi:hypothetical protein
VRGARDATRVLVISTIVDEKWLQWLKEKLRSVVTLLA